MGIAFNGKKISGLAYNGKKISGIAYNGEVIYSSKSGDPKIYGIKRLISQSSPTWERTDDAVGLYAEATHDGSTVKNDFDSLYPWSDIKTVNYDPVQNKVVAYIGDANFSFTHDYVMTIIPEFWYKRWQDDDYEYIQISAEEADGFTKSEEFMIGRYTISGSSSAVYSRSGQSPLCNVNITDFRSYAQKIGIGWGQLDWRHFVIQLLYLVEYANYDSQNILGQGNVNNNSILTSGECNNLGMKSGCLVNNGKHSVIYRGLEDIFGNIFQFVDGINMKSRVAYICYDPSKYADNTFSGNYTAIGYTNGSSNGYIKTLGYDANNPLISLPTASGESSSTYIPDYYYQSIGNRIVLVGGRYDHGSHAGLWFWGLSNTSSVANTYIGARLLYYGKINK